MCWEKKCSKCKKSTWGGCGKHLEMVFRNIPYDKRCWCGYDPAKVNELIKIEKEKGLYGPYPLVTKN